MKRLVRSLPFLQTLAKKINPYNLHVPPGHYYSPIPDLSDIKSREHKIFSDDKTEGIDLNDSKHVELLSAFKASYSKIDFPAHKSASGRYFYENDMYGRSSAALLFCMIHHLKPKRIIEVGSGFSSALMLDVNNTYFNNNIKLTFIEPFPQRLKSLLKEEDYQYVSIIENRLENIDTGLFNELEENDILFIDSTHVSKVGSDVNTLLFKVIPRLNKGVYIHIHDVFYPFEYPKEWIYKGVSWNEVYLIRAFLMHNTTFKIQYLSSYALERFRNEIADFPLFKEDIGGCLWIKKVQ